MGLQHVPVIYHFGPDSMAPKSFENTNPNDKGALLRFVATQTGSQINEEDAFKPEKNHSALILTVSVFAILAGLMYVEFLTPAMVFKNFYIWSISIMVRLNNCDLVYNGFSLLSLSCYPGTCG